MPICSLILDLDDTLFDCTGLLTDAARLRATHSILQFNAENTADYLCELQAELSDEIGSTEALREIGRRLELSAKVVESATAEYNRDEVEEIHTFPDVPDTLAALAERGYKLSLVTAGRKDRQRAKIQRLGLDDVFSDSLGNLWIHDADADKTGPLHEAADRMGFDPQQVLSVGDKLDADIAVSNRLGMVTARLLHGRQKERSPASPDETPDHTIARISDLLKLLPRLE
jgi:putative hydrolase of the HAD superfamily